MNSIDGNILYQAIDPLTKTVSPEFYKQFESVGEETLNLIIELKTVMTSNITRRNQNIANFFRKLDGQLPSLPTPFQDWFKKFYKNRLSPEAKALVLEQGPLKSLDKNYAFDCMNGVVNSLNWFTPNSLPPVGTLNQKVPCNMGTLPKNVNSADLALYASKMARIRICKDRAIGPVIPKVAAPTASHGQPLVGDYEFPKRMGKIATEYMSKIQKLMGDNAKYVMDNFRFKPATNNVQTGAPSIKIPTKVGDTVVNSTLFGPTVKNPIAGNPFLPKMQE
jgi:hypothetical protein